MYGAILGDMIGAPYEFDRGNKSKEFPLLIEESQFTDDTVMTIAVAEALLDSRFRPEEELREELIRSLRKWGKRYPDAGYGARFIRWLQADEPRPYGSCGNGSAMRVSSVGWLFDTIEETRRMARLTAEITHDHPEGLKGAEAVASAIFLARNGSGKDEIRDYVSREFGYDLSRSCDEIRPGYHHVETCQKTVPEAFAAFFEGEDFEDVIRTAVSLGGDCDTLTCIAGSIAEAFYGVPAILEAECESRLTEDVLDVLRRFNIVREHGHDSFPDDFLSGNVIIEEAIRRFHEQGGEYRFAEVLDAVVQRMVENGQLLMPVVVEEGDIDLHELEHARVGDVLQGGPRRFRWCNIKTQDGKNWLALFTSPEEYEKGEHVCVISWFIDAMLESCRDTKADGFVINPWGEAFFIPRELIGPILQEYEEAKQS